MTEIRQHRFALSVFFLLNGFCFATWASRIPSIKMIYELNDAQLGNLLLTLPIGSLIGVPLSGWLVSKFDSRKPMIFSFMMFAIALGIIGLSNAIIVLIMAVFLFSFSMRIINIAMNTQSISIQKNYSKNIVGSFHGLWSTGGLLGVAFATWMVSLNVSMKHHLLMVAIFAISAISAAYPFLLKNDKSPHGNKLIIGKPDKSIMLIGMLVFFAAVCEGGIFDWSGVYFKEIVKEDLFTLGYLIFMAFMALSRFFSDILIERIGMKRLYVISSLLISTGISICIFFPYFWPCIFGLCITGVGVAAVFPMTFMLAGRSKKYSPGMAISIVATYAIVGMLIGPPLIGYMAHAFNLKVSFAIFVFSGLMLIPISQLYFKEQEQEH